MKNKIIKLAVEMVSVLSGLPEDTYQKEKLMALCGASNNVRHFWQVVFDIADQHRPLQLEDRFVVCGVSYPVIDNVRSQKAGLSPVVDIPMMSDEKWKELASTPEQIRRRENTKKYGNPFID